MAQSQRSSLNASESASSTAVHPDAPDLTSQPTLYVVGYAHLDTQWRWEYPQVISEYLPKTLHDNFALFEKYPDYIFNFSGANRYLMHRIYGCSGDRVLPWPPDGMELRFA